jgi:hypothetical protein
MRFSYDLTIPSGTIETAPEQRAIQLVPGRITRIIASFRRGPHNLVFVRVRQGLFHVFPVADSDAVFGDGIDHNVPMDFSLAPPTPELILEGWAPNTRYPHTITFTFDVSPAGGDERSTLLELLLGAPARGEA